MYFCIIIKNTIILLYVRRPKKTTRIKGSQQVRKNTDEKRKL
ncbi:MAG: hypothetical protein BWY22_02522 [Bacteroidetes bacterium ADurb.Bin217]|nr:MAG: hypothetical protein BWY22_02522 [Bacteroidetes bacterium ADurb.Bin217]